MKKNKIFDAIGMIDDKMIADAKRSKAKKLSKKQLTSVAAIFLAGVIILGALLFPKSNSALLKTYAISAASYPDSAEYPDESLYRGNKLDEINQKYYEQSREKIKNYNNLTIGPNSFFEKSIPKFLCNTKGENKIYSPINVYMALAMLAEVTNANSRKQLLDLLGYDSIDTLRREANIIWNSNYTDNDAVSAILASSLWLNENINYKQAVMNTLSEYYYSSSYRGEMGSDDFNKALQVWLNEQTGGLLENQTENIRFDSQTVMALATTIYFKARWENEFSESKTESGIFHSPQDEITCDFMNQSTVRSYYWEDNFSAVLQGLTDSGGMWFILPDEGITAEELLYDKELIDFILDSSSREKSTRLMVNLSVPKFDVQSQFDLCEDLKALGITDVFDENLSDFSSMTDDIGELVLSQAIHGARVKIDEEGCTAAAFTVMAINGSSPPPNDEIDFILDRPFIFVITSNVGTPLFIGIVKEP